MYLKNLSEKIDISIDILRKTLIEENKKKFIAILHMVRTPLLVPKLVVFPANLPILIKRACQ